MSQESQDPVSQKTTQRRAWKKPKLERLGRISDIAGPPIPFAQAAGNKFS